MHLQLGLGGRCSQWPTRKPPSFQGPLGANVPQRGIGREGPLGTDTSGAGGAVFEKERTAQQPPTSHG